MKPGAAYNSCLKGNTPSPDDAAGTGSRRIKHRVLAIGISLVVFLASVWHIAQTFQWQEIGRVLKGVNLAGPFAGGCASIMAYWLLRTLRWRILLRQTDHCVPLLDLYLCSAVSLSFALFTPLQSGEMLKVELLKKYGMIQRAPGYGSFVVEKVLDLTALLAMACVSLLTVLNILPDRSYVYAILGCLIAGGLAFLIIVMKIRLAGRPQQLIDHMRQCVGDWRAMVWVTALTCASWAAVVVSWQVFLSACGIHLDFARAVALMSIVGLIGILSFIPGGAGISEVGTSQLLMHFGFAAAIAQAGSFMLRLVTILAIGLGVIHLGLWKLVRSRRSRRLAMAETAGKNLGRTEHST